MFNMFMFVIALVIAQILSGVIMLALLLNRKVMGWFTKKYMKTINEISEDLSEDLLDLV